MQKRSASIPGQAAGFLRRLARDSAGNTLALIAAGILPLLGVIGGGVDMGRAYLVEARLQQACDAGVLAARKALGAQDVSSGIPAQVGEMGQRFFNLNFRNGIYGSEDRDFVMTVDSSTTISGTASVSVPTSIMGVFGYEQVDVSVACASKLNFSALDVMMVLDVTGSMRHTNAGDTLSRIDSMKQVIRNFHTSLEAAKAPGSTIRYGFVPYATNVNVGHLLEDDWVATTWDYQSREDTGVRVPAVHTVYYQNWAYVSGTRSGWTTQSSYDATYHAPSGADETGYYTCDNALPASSWSYTDTKTSETRTIQVSPPAVVTTEYYTRVHNGTRYRHSISGTTCNVQSDTDNAYTQTYERVTFVPSLDQVLWKYDQLEFDVSSWRTDTDGCIEERKSTQLSDFSNVDLTENLDLNIDLVPSAADPDTQWKPHWPDKIFVRKILQNGSGSVSKPQSRTADEYADTGMWWFSDCPAKAQKLTEMDATSLDNYLATLTPYGATYHDIGMIWGARLISPTGLYASENAGSGGEIKTRHMIFLTDGQTEPYDLSYGAYGVDALDQRRWDSTFSLTLAETIEERFKFACLEAKKRNVTVWVIAFGTYANQAMMDCAGTGRYFEAADAQELNEAFQTIANSMADLRLSK